GSVAFVDGCGRPSSKEEGSNPLLAPTRHFAVECGDAVNIPPINFAVILPVIVLSVFGVIIMVAEPFVPAAKKSLLGWLAFAGVIVATIALLPMSANAGQWYSNLWIVDNYSIFFHVIFLLIAAVTILTALDFLPRERINHAEFYALLLFATV